MRFLVGIFGRRHPGHEFITTRCQTCRSCDSKKQKKQAKIALLVLTIVVKSIELT